MLALCSMLLVTYYAFNYTCIIGRGLLITEWFDRTSACNIDFLSVTDSRHKLIFTQADKLWYRGVWLTVPLKARNHLF